jgi:hypothetical protein
MLMIENNCRCLIKKEIKVSNVGLRNVDNRIVRMKEGKG